MDVSPKRLLILGAGPNQLPAILRAGELGAYVITADYLPDNVGHRFSHQSVDCSTTDKAGILAVAKSLGINGIATFASDVATPTVGYVAEELGLPGCTLATALVMSDKGRFRKRQRECRLSSPGFVVGQSFGEIEDELAGLTPPLLFKPVDSSGSRGITRVESASRDHTAPAFAYAQAFSRSQTVCVEEFVEGVEVGGDAFLLDGRLAFAAITHKHRQGFVVTGHSLPPSISEEDQSRVSAELSANCRAAGYTDGPLNFDVMVTPDRVTVLEMSPRLGGNGIPEIIARGTGVDLTGATISFALGDRVEFRPKVESVGSCGSWVFGSDTSGVLLRIASEEVLRNAVPEVFKYVVGQDVGTRVSEFVHNGNSLGYALFDLPPAASYARTVARLMQALSLVVE